MRDTILLSPEIYLRELNNKIQFLYKDALWYGNTVLEEDIKNLMKKTIVSEIFNEKYTIAISGLQGVGKTTLLKSFYNIPEDIIPETRGIGEKMPVMITEWDNSEYGYSAKIIKQIKEERTGKLLMEVTEIQIESAEEFKNIAMEPSSEYIYLELKVPYKYFKTDKKSFVLLPGVNQSNDGWNELTKHVLYNSSNYILVFNEQRLNDSSNTALVENIRKEFNTSKPIIALTFGDQSSDCNKSLKNEVVKRFGIIKDEEDRIIRTSVDINEIERWKREMINALDKYSSLQKESRVKQLKVLNKLLSEDLEGILMDLAECDSEQKDRMSNKIEYNIRNIMKELNKSKNEIKKTYRRKLNEELDEITERAAKNFRDKIIEKNLFEKIKATIFSESLKDKKRFEEEIMNSWKSGEGNSNQSLSEKLVIKTMEEEYSQVFVLKEYKQLLLSEGERECAVTLMIEPRESNREQGVRKELNKACQDIMGIFSKEGEINLTDEVKESIEYIPLLALNMMLLESGEEGFRGVESNISSVYSEGGDILNGLTGNVMDTRQGILKGIVAILGIDSLDGSGDIVKAIASSIGIKLSGATTIAISAGIGLGIAGMNLASEVNKMDLYSDSQGKILIHAMKERQFSRLDEKFSDLIDKTFNKIEKQLQRGYRLSEEESRSIRCNKNIMDIYTFKNQIRENICGHINYLE